MSAEPLIRFIDARSAAGLRATKELFRLWNQERAGGKPTAQLEGIKSDIAKIVLDVRARGNSALLEYTEQFDHQLLTPRKLKVSKREIRKAYESVPRELVHSLRRAAQNIERFHRASMRGSWQEKPESGVMLGQKVTPIERVGVYVPGGKAYYPSSVLMNVIPAKVAGCSEIIMVSPPSYNGTIHPAMLVAADIAGATRIFKVGGAQGIAALAYGTESIPAVDKIVGPGNIYVTLAKQYVQSEVSIDKPAGPSEVFIIADKDANAGFIAADMLAQAEHEELASAIVVVVGRRAAAQVYHELGLQLGDCSRSEIIRSALRGQSAIVMVKNIEDAAELANVKAPEHLELAVANPIAYAKAIRNAGAILLGQYSPAAVGDYIAGPNHVLPTAGFARFVSPLMTDDFLKVSNVIMYTRQAIENVVDDIERIAMAEGLDAHYRAVRRRCKTS